MKTAEYILCFAFCILIATGTGRAANILFYFGVSSYSHRISVWPLVEELAARNHSTTFLSPFPPKSPNPKVTEIHPNALGKLFEDDQNSIMEHRAAGQLQNDWEALPMFGVAACEIMLKTPEVKKLTKTAKFDLVIIDGLFNDCGLGLAHFFKAKYIVFSTTSVTMWLNELSGIVPESSWIPEMNYYYEEPMSFLQRVHNTYIPLYWHFWVRQRNYFPELEVLMRKELDIPDMPALKDIEKNTSLIFINTHHSIEYARSLPPLYVPVGGLHIVDSADKKKELPKEMENFIDGSGPGGVIYVSFGTYALVSKLPPEIKSVLFEVFGSFKSTRFIWKFDIDRPKDLPDNIMSAKWVPQQALLLNDMSVFANLHIYLGIAHKKVRAFISHGGLLGIQEAIYYGVPIIAFPLFAEQDYNANLLQKSGCGIKMEIIGIKKEKLRDAISKILQDNSFKLRMLEVSKLFKDRPATPLATAVWWTEHILRTGDANSLKPLSLYQTWYERRLLDVWLFIFTVIFSTISAALCILSKCFCHNRQLKAEEKQKRS